MNPPPIEKSPGDLLFFLNTAVNALKRIRNDDPTNFVKVTAIADVTKVALDHWIQLPEDDSRRDPRGPHSRIPQRNGDH